MREGWCKTFWIGSHILDRSLVSSCRAGILTVFTFSEGNALAHSCTPNKQSCIYQRQDNTHLIRTSNCFSAGQQVWSFWFIPGRQLCNTENISAHLNKNVHMLNTNTLPNTHTLMTALPLPWCHSLGSFFADVGAYPIKCLGSNQH